jgi:hypothetical protein
MAGCSMAGEFQNCQLCNAKHLLDALTHWLSLLIHWQCQGVLKGARLATALEASTYLLPWS